MYTHGRMHSTVAGVEIDDLDDRALRQIEDWENPKKSRDHLFHDPGSFLLTSGSINSSFSLLWPSAFSWPSLLLWVLPKTAVQAKGALDNLRLQRAFFS